MRYLLVSEFKVASVQCRLTRIVAGTVQSLTTASTQELSSNPYVFSNPFLSLTRTPFILSKKGSGLKAKFPPQKEPKERRVSLNPPKDI